MSTAKKPSRSHHTVKSLLSGDKEGRISGATFGKLFGTADRHCDRVFRCSLGDDGMVIFSGGYDDIAGSGLGSGVEVPVTLSIFEGLSLHILAIGSNRMCQALRERGTMRETLTGKTFAINFSELKINADWLLTLSGEESRSFMAVRNQYRRI